jgi:hypothetical protein
MFDTRPASSDGYASHRPPGDSWPWLTIASVPTTLAGRQRGVRRRAGTIGAQRFGETEVEHFHRAVLADFDVGGLQIAMNDALLMRRLEGLGDLSCDGQGFIDRHPALREVGQSGPLDQFHHQSMRVAAVFETVDLRDIWMVEAGEELRLAPETGQAVGPLPEGLRQDLQHAEGQFMPRCH